jgi:hypothetical protein
MFSSGRTRTPPSGSPSSDSKSDDESALEMWYVALTPTYQLETIMLELSEEEDAWSVVATSHVERVIFIMLWYFYFELLISSLISKYRQPYLDSNVRREGWRIRKKTWEGNQAQLSLGKKGHQTLEEGGGLSLKEGDHHGHGGPMVRWRRRVLKGCLDLEEVVLQGLSLLLDLNILLYICV